MTSEQVNMPCFIFKENEFKENITNFQKVLNQYFPRNKIGYSFKTNSLPYILGQARKLGCYAETVSDMEYQLAEKIGYQPQEIIFNGPIKGKEQFIQAFQNGSIINIDSNREIMWLKECSDRGIKGNIGIRVNMDLEKLLPGQTSMGTEGGRFGFSDENGTLHMVVQEIMQMKGIHICGLHMHVSSKSKSVEVYQELTNRACVIAKREGLVLQYLDVGGGFFGGGDHGEAYKHYVKIIYETLKKYNMEKLMLIVEPGAAVVATAVDYRFEVLDVKETNRNCFVVTNGSRLHIDPFLHKDRYSYTLLDMASENIVGKQVVTGYTCMENDRIMTLENEKKLSPGDQIICHIVGSYTMTFNPLFIEYLPIVYTQKGNDYQVIREKWGVEEYLQKSKWE